jgi:GxxExxY protein
MARGGLIHERLTYSVIGAFFEVYNALGFGILEHVYVAALERELLARGHCVGREVSVPILYKGEALVRQRLDMIIDETLVVETKATRDLQRDASRQVYNYLRATTLEVGLLLHFGPRPRFYRIERLNSPASNNRAVHPHDLTHPAHLIVPFVIDACRSADAE